MSQPMFSQFTFDDALRSYAVASTPGFIIRKFKVDEQVMQLHRSYRPEGLFGNLSTALDLEPETMRDAALPLILLVALSLYENKVCLMKALSLYPTSNVWFNRLVERFSDDLDVSIVQQPPSEQPIVDHAELVMIANLIHRSVVLRHDRYSTAAKIINALDKHRSEKSKDSEV